MKLDRNLNADGSGKYALLKLRKLRAEMCPEYYTAVKVLEDAGILDWGNTLETEFFVMRLKDEYAPWGLSGYALSAAADDPEYAGEIQAMAQRAGVNNPHHKKPD